MIDSVPLIQNPNDVQQINASIIAMKKASRELDEKIAQFNKLLSQEITNREKAITEAINSLDVPSVGGSGKYISAISETDGKISATESEITSTVSSGNSQPVTSGGVAEAIDNIYYQGVKYGANYDCNTMGEGLAIVNEQTLNTPYKQGLTTATIAYIYTKSISSTPNTYRIQFAVSYSGNELFVRSYTNNGWVAWQRELRNIDLTSSVTSGSSAPVTSGGVYAELQKRNPAIITFQNNTGNVKYFKISNILADLSWGDAVYLLESRAGELLLISVGHGDGVTVPPKAKRLLDVYTKILGIAYMNNSRDLYIKVATWSHELVLTRLTSYGMNDPALSIVQEITVNEYSSATAITIET